MKVISILVTLLLFFVSFNIFGQLLNPSVGSQAVEFDFLDKLIADRTVAPAIVGNVYRHKVDPNFQNVKEFEKVLKRQQISFKGKKTLLVFWEQKDKYSKLLLPKLEKIRNKYRQTELQIFLVNTNDFDKKATLVEFLNNYNRTENVFNSETNQYYEKKLDTYYKPLTIPIIFVDKKNKDRYGITAFPSTVLIDKEGLVYTAMVGYFAEYDEWIVEAIEGIDLQTEE